MRRALGFTLLEVLIAMTIFSILGLASNQMLRSVSSIESQMEERTDEYRTIVRVFKVIDRDISALVYRGVRDEFGDPIAAVSVNQGLYPLEFTRGGWRNPLKLPRSQLQRVAYQYNGEALQRVVWLVLDRAQDATPRVQTLMTGVTDFKVSLIKADGSRQEVITAEDGDELPVGIEIRITTELWGDLIRRVNLPEYIPFAMQGGTGALEAENNVNDIETDQNDEFDPASQPLSPSLDERAL